MPLSEGPESTVRARIANVDLNLLVPLQALLRERSVTRAASSVGITQPAMSNTLARLRRVLHDEVLVRGSGGYHLTPRAQALVEPVDAALELIGGEILGRPAFDPGAVVREFTVAASSSTAFVLLPTLLRRLLPAAPGVSLRIVPTTRRIDVLLENRDIDLALLPEVLPTEFPRERLYEERWVFMVAADNPVTGEGLTPEVFATLPHAVYESEGLRTHAELALAAHGYVPSVRLKTNDFLAIPLLLPGTKLVAVVQERVARRLVPRHDLRIVPSPVPLPGFGIDLVSRRGGDDAALDWLRAELVIAAASIREVNGSASPT